MDLEKIEKLNELKEKGAITEAEFQQAKAEALASNKSLDVATTPSPSAFLRSGKRPAFLRPRCRRVAISG